MTNYDNAHLLSLAAPDTIEPPLVRQLVCLALPLLSLEPLSDKTFQLTTAVCCSSFSSFPS